MDGSSFHLPTRAGMAGGILTVLIRINIDELLTGALMAAIGTTVSYLVTLALKWVLGQVNKKG